MDDFQRLKELWRKFDRGDSLTTQDLVQLRDSAAQGEAYLAARGEHLACFKTRIDLNRIDDYIKARTQKAG